MLPRRRIVARRACCNGNAITSLYPQLTFILEVRGFIRSHNPVREEVT